MLTLLTCFLFMQQPKSVWIVIPNEYRAQLEKVTPIKKSKTTIKNNLIITEIEEEKLAALSQELHETLRKCGGFTTYSRRDLAMKILNEPRVPVVQTLNYTISEEATITPLLEELKEENIRDIIIQLSSFPNRYYTSQSGEDSAVWLSELWKSYAINRPDAQVRLFQHNHWRQPSVLLMIEGTQNPDDYVVIGGHLDSISGSVNGGKGEAPGADDDASGIASFSEMARVLLETGFRPQKSLIFIGYAAEEVGLRGSAEIANIFRAQNANVLGVLQLDMTNYNFNDGGIYITTDRTNAEQNKFLLDLNQTYLNYPTGDVFCGYGCSDHSSWHSAGFRASFPFEASNNDYNRHIHTLADTLETSGGDAMHALKFSQLALTYAVELAKGEQAHPKQRLSILDFISRLNNSEPCAADPIPCFRDKNGDRVINLDDIHIDLPFWGPTPLP